MWRIPRHIHSSFSYLKPFSVLSSRSSSLSSSPFLSFSSSHFSLSPSFSFSLSRSFSSIASLLQSQHTDIIQNETAMLQHLHSVIMKIDINSPELSIIKDTLSGINDLFMIVVVGEFNSGKSTFINSLLGGNYLKTGVLPTTSKVCVLRSQQASKVWKATENLLLKDFEEIDLPVDWLKHIAIIDTPGTNAIYSHHEKITHQVIPRSDLILFVTSVERPISESEAVFLRKICEWGKKVIIVVNKMDTITPLEREEVLTFVAQNCASIIGTTHPIPIFGVASRLGLNAKLSAQSNAANHSNEKRSGSWDDGNIQSLERYLLDILGTKQMIQMKLENPLKVSDRVITLCEATLAERQEMLEGDLRVLEYVEEHMSTFHSDIERDIEFFRQQIRTLVQNLNQKGEQFIDENVTITKPEFLYNQKTFETAFNSTVITDINHPIDDIINDISQFITKRARLQADAVGAYLGSRPSRYTHSIIGHIRGLEDTSDMFTGSRQILLERLRRDTNELMKAYDYTKEGNEIAKMLNTSMKQVFAIQSLSAAAATGLFLVQFIDITGVLAMTGFAASSLLVIPYRKKVLKEEYTKRILLLQTKLDEILSNNIRTQLLNINEKIQDSIGPYSRFVRVENKKATELLDELKIAKRTVNEIRSKIST